jgi:protein TonB
MTRLGAIGVTLALHAVVIVALLQLEPVRTALTDGVPIFVSLIAPAPKTELKPDVLPKPLPVKPRVQRTKPLDTPPITTAVTEHSAPFVSPPVSAETLVAREAAPAPPPVSAPAPVSAAPVPVTPPAFNAGYLNNPPPDYPPLSRRMHEEGKVILRVFVSEQGLPSQVEIRTSSGYTRLDDVALSTVRQWKFIPARRGEMPVAAWVLVPISFTLRS